MARTAYQIAENQPGKIGFTLTDPAVTDANICATTSTAFTDLDASCQIVSASVPVSQTVNREEVPGTWCEPIPQSSVTSVVDEFSVDLTVLLDENQVTGVTRWLFENSGKTAWIFIGADGDEPPKAVAEVRVAAATLFGAPGEIRTATLTLPASGKPAVCFGDATASAGVGGNSDPLNISATYPAAAAAADLTTLQADAVSGDTGTGSPYNGGTGTDPAFSTGQYIVLGDASQANWTGTGWVAGAA